MGNVPELAPSADLVLPELLQGQLRHARHFASAREPADAEDVRLALARMEAQGETALTAQLFEAAQALGSRS